MCPTVARGRLAWGVPSVFRAASPPPRPIRPRRRRRAGLGRARPCGHSTPASPRSASAACAPRSSTPPAGRPPTSPATTTARLGALNDALARDDLDAIVCLRGGYGLLRILDRIDYAAARAHPKLVVGYSDVTALHLALWGRGGPDRRLRPDGRQRLGAGLDAETEADFWRVVGGDAGYDVRGPGGEALVPLATGEAEGVLLGGNLALVTALLGTPYLPDLTGAILFVEDVGEAPYRIDGMLARLRLAGVLEQLGGLVFGMFTGAEVAPDRPTFTVDEVLAHYAPLVGGPVASRAGLRPRPAQEHAARRRARATDVWRRRLASTSSTRSRHERDTLLGLVAAACTTGSFVPQVVKTWRSGSSADLSLGMYGLFTAGIVLWLAYGIVLRDLPIVVANVVTLGLVASVLVHIVRSRRSPAGPRADRPPTG